MRGLLIAAIVLTGTMTQIPTSLGKPLLGGILGGGGRIDGSASASGGVVAGASGGLLTGLLGNVVGGAGGLLGGDLLHTVACLLDQLGLDIILHLLEGLGMTDVVGLNDICQSEGGDALLGILFDGGILNLDLIEQVLCLVKSLNLEVVLQLLNSLGLEEALRLNEIVCPDGEVLMDFSASASGLLGSLTSVIGVDGVLGGGLTAILDLDNLLSLEGVLDIQGLVGKLLCLLKGAGLQAVVDLIDQLGLDDVLKLQDVICDDGNALIDSSLSPGGILNLDLVVTLQCLLHQLGLDVLVQILDGLNIGDMLSLNDVCQSEGGLAILNNLFGDLNVIDQVLCLIKSLKLEAVLQLLDNLGLDEALRLYEIVCPDGEALMDFSASASGLLGSLTSVIGVDGVLGGGLNAILDLDNLLSLEGVLDIQGLVGKLLCLLKGAGLQAVVDLIDQLGLDDVLKLQDVICDDGNALIDSSLSPGGILNLDLVVTLQCLLHQLGLDVLVQILDGLNIGDMLSLNDVCQSEGGLSILNNLFGDLNVIDQVLCLIKSLKLEAVLQLLDNLGLDEALRLYEIVCPDGEALMEFSASASGLLGSLTSVIGVDGVLGGGLSAILDLDNLLSLEGVLDIQGLVGKLLCLLKGAGLQAVVDLIDQLGLDDVLKLQDVICDDGNALIDSSLSPGGILNLDLVVTLQCLLHQLGLDVLVQILDGLNIGDMSSLNDVCQSEGGLVILNNLFGDLNVIDQVLCLIKSLGLEAVLQLLDDLGLAKVLDMHDTVCPDGEPLMNFMSDEGGSASFAAQILMGCEDGDYSACSAVIKEVYDNHGCEAICPVCSMVQNEMAGMDCMTICEDETLCPSFAGGVMVGVDASAEATVQ